MSEETEEQIVEVPVNVWARVEKCLDWVSDQQAKEAEADAAEKAKEEAETAKKAKQAEEATKNAAEAAEAVRRANEGENVDSKQITK